MTLTLRAGNSSRACRCHLREITAFEGLETSVSNAFSASSKMIVDHYPHYIIIYNNNKQIKLHRNTIT